jgi:hypothetical protein
MRLYRPFRQRGDMTRLASSALVLQEGGALGAHELGAARRALQGQQFRSRCDRRRLDWGDYGVLLAASIGVGCAAV